VQDAIFIAAPPGIEWPLTMESLSQRLEEQLPGVQIFPPKQGAASGKRYLPFEVTLDGQVRHATYFDRSHLILNDGPPALWAGTIIWFLALLPPGMPAVAMVENNPEEVVPIPAAADAEAIHALLDGLANAD
jgi:hypothetical protein